MHSAARPPTFPRSVRWSLAASAVAALAIFVTVEPMRWSLPPRLFFKPLDFYRVGAVDYTMCMRVELSIEEARAFIKSKFSPEDRIDRAIPAGQGLCPADFWPSTVEDRTLAYSETRWPNGMVEGSNGAFYKAGHLYFWSWTQ